MMTRLYWIHLFNLVIIAKKSPSRVIFLPRIGGSSPVTSCILNATSNRLLAICRLLSQPPYAHPDIHCTVMIDKPGVYHLEHKTWGSLATFDVSALPASQSFLITHFPEYPNIAETQLFSTELLLE